MFWIKQNTPCVFLCHEGFKNGYFVGVRNVEGENYLEHTVSMNDFMFVIHTYAHT